MHCSVRLLNFDMQNSSTGYVKRRAPAATSFATSLTRPACSLTLLASIASLDRVHKAQAVLVNVLKDREQFPDQFGNGPF